MPTADPKNMRLAARILDSMGHESTGDLLHAAADEIERRGEALRIMGQLAALDSSAGSYQWNSTRDAMQRWIDAGMTGPLPDLPEWARQRG